MSARPRITKRHRVFSKMLRQDMTDGERRLWRHLRAHRFQGWKFKRQHPLGKHIVDCVCIEAKLVVEIDGAQHALNRKEDALRTEALEKLGFRVIRFSASDAVKRTEDVLLTIFRELGTPSPQPSPSDYGVTCQACWAAGRDSGFLVWFTGTGLEAGANARRSSF